MRETRFYGNTLGAIEVELRKGSVNKIILGNVRRYSAGRLPISMIGKLPPNPLIRHP